MAKVKASGGPSKAQKEWVSKLRKLAGAVAGGGEETAGGEEQEVQTLTGEQRQALDTAIKKGFLPGIPDFPGGEIPGKVIDTLLGERSALVRVRNNTAHTLRLDPLSLRDVDDEKKIGKSHGKFNSLPPDSIDPNKGREFLLSSNTFAGLTTTGAEARIRYFLDDQNTAWIIHFDNSPFQKSKGDVLLDGPNKAQFKSPQPVINDAKASVFAFTLDQVGGGKRPGGGGSGTDISSSCLITVNNKTEQELTLVDQGHVRGDFMTFPPATLAPGASDQFVSIETPNSPDQGCQGFIEWEIGSPAVATCRMEWDNPEQKKNTTKTKITPTSAGFKVLDQIGQAEENVPVAFTISGGGGGTVPPEKQTVFKPPTESKQPTLRKGDKSEDGWVEYLQHLLNSSGNQGKLDVDGDFGSATHKAVIRFQSQNGLMVDGIVGNQTWAALREDKPEAPSTDRREPGTFVEKGVEARWSTESSKSNRYIGSTDTFQLAVDSVGDTEIKNAKATIRVTAPGMKPKNVERSLGPAKTRDRDGGALKSLHVITIKNFRKQFPSADPAAPVTDYLVEAYLPKELGGDFYRSNVRLSDLHS